MKTTHTCKLYDSTTKLFVLSVCVSFLFSACSNSSTQSKIVEKKVDTIECWVDSSLWVLANQASRAFENVYIYPRLALKSHDEADIIKALIDDKVNLAFLHRRLDSAESNFIQRKESFTPKQYEIGYDAYVFITSERSSQQVLDYKELKSYLSSSKPTGDFVLCVENAKSQTVSYLKSHFKLDATFVDKLSSLGNMTSMMDYIRNNPGSIALIPFSLIADIESEKTVKFLEGLKVMNVRVEDSSGLEKVIEPSQSSLATKEYPLISPIVLVNCNMKEKSGTNFVNYIFKPKAQRLIQQFGLCPAIFPGREFVIHQ